jgi:hypothetical protein
VACIEHRPEEGLQPTFDRTLESAVLALMERQETDQGGSSHDRSRTNQGEWNGLEPHADRSIVRDSGARPKLRLPDRSARNSPGVVVTAFEAQRGTRIPAIARAPCGLRGAG